MVAVVHQGHPRRSVAGGKLEFPRDERGGRAERAAVQTAEVVAGDVLDDAPAGSRTRTVAEHRLAPDHPIAYVLVAKARGRRGRGSDRPSDRRATRVGRVDRPALALRGELARELREGGPRPHDADAIGG